MTETEESRPVADGFEDVKPYKIRVSSKYLDLTRQKLELTRLPHEGGSEDVKSDSWWEPKAQIESLIDFWLEQYSWRDQEDDFNKSLPQFRTGVRIASPAVSVRTHFIHARSPHENAVPLLLIPPFPVTNVSLGHLIKPLTDPSSADNGTNASPTSPTKTQQPFHLVIPSLPGLGFSDALPSNVDPVATTAEILDVLMKRLGYDRYLATNAEPTSTSSGQADWKLVSRLARQFSGSCLGAHFVAPPTASPQRKEAPVEWAKWKIAKALKKPILGYTKEDVAVFAATKQSKSGKKALSHSHNRNEISPEPNTLAYALCDSPVGLLAHTLKCLRLMGSRHEFSPAEIITFTELAWLPGPEGAMRFWANCAKQTGDKDVAQPKQRGKTPKPKVAVTVFNGGEESPGSNSSGSLTLSHPDSLYPRQSRTKYSCPLWLKRDYDVVCTNRISGLPGLLAWEKPDVIIAGVQDLAREVLARDEGLAKRFQKTPAASSDEKKAEAPPTDQAKTEKPQEKLAVPVAITIDDAATKSEQTVVEDSTQQQQQQQQLDITGAASPVSTLLPSPSAPALDSSETLQTISKDASPGLRPETKIGGKSSDSVPKDSILEESEAGQKKDGVD